jgi:nucleoside-diphosphate-sugar epimerase
VEILVTGASGFVGGAIVEWLAAHTNFSIVATGRSMSNRFSSLPNVRYAQHDLRHSMPEIVCDVCIHCAGLADDSSSENEFFENNPMATSNLLQALRGCRQFVFISSASVYAFQDGMPKQEKDVAVESRLTAYGRSKLQAEQVVMASGIPSVYIFRPRAVYGAGDRVLMPRLLKLIRNGRMVVPGQLSKRSSLTHIDNLCEAVTKAMKQAKEGIHIFNIADSRPYDLQSVFDAMLLAKTGRLQYIRIPVSMIRGLIRINQMLGRKANFTEQSLHYLIHEAELNIGKSRNDLEYEATRDFSDFLAVFHAMLRKEPEGI